MRVLPLVALLGSFAAACATNEPPKPAAPVDPLVVGKSPDAQALLVASEKPAPVEDGKIARGNAPAIWLDSLTTHGKASLPAGKVVVVHFWATWCGPCAKSFPMLQALYAKYKGRGLEVAAISVDDEKSGIADFARRHGANFPVAWDDGHRVAQAYQVDTMPSTMLVDQNGNVARTFQGYHDGQDAELEGEIKALLP